MPRRAQQAIGLIWLALGDALGCPGSRAPIRSDAGQPRAVALRGRVVDFESCLSAAGCQGVADLGVSVVGSSAAKSITPSSGRFELLGVLDGTPTRLSLADPKQNRYLPSAHGQTITPAGADLFGLEIYALKRDGALYRGITRGAEVSIETQGICLGQVFRVASGLMKAISGVAVQSTPGAAQVLYVNCIESFSQCASETTLAQGASATGVFGEFLLVSGTGPGTFELALTSSSTTFEATRVSLAPGYLVLGVHEAK